MTLKVYKLNESPPARAVMMLGGYLDLPVELIDLNLMAGEHLKPEFLKKNPLHSVPTLEDGDLILIDSHAILMYLVDTYAKDDSLYPKDVKKRALVNQRLFFDTSILFPRLRNITYPIFIKGAESVEDDQLLDIDEAYGFLEQFLSTSKYIAGDKMTIADISAFADVSSLAYLVAVDGSKYPKIKAWLAEMENKDFAKAYNTPGLISFGSYVTSKIGHMLAAKTKTLKI